MLRSYKFRGQRIDNGEWIVGYYKVGITGRVTIFTFTECLFEVIPETVGQFTGIVDKNGQEIYEGDIVSAWSQGVKAIGEVKQRIDGLWLIYPAYQKEMFWGLMPNLKCETTVEVIGNIHDNPELMEG